VEGAVGFGAVAAPLTLLEAAAAAAGCEEAGPGVAVSAVAAGLPPAMAASMATDQGGRPGSTAPSELALPSPPLAAAALPELVPDALPDVTAGVVTLWLVEASAAVTVPD
jgi:hypothetical protein